MDMDVKKSTILTVLHIKQRCGRLCNLESQRCKDLREAVVPE